MKLGSQALYVYCTIFSLENICKNTDDLGRSTDSRHRAFAFGNMALESPHLPPLTLMLVGLLGMRQLPNVMIGGVLSWACPLTVQLKERLEILKDITVATSIILRWLRLQSWELSIMSTSATFTLVPLSIRPIFTVEIISARSLLLSSAPKIQLEGYSILYPSLTFVLVFQSTVWENPVPTKTEEIKVREITTSTCPTTLVSLYLNLVIMIHNQFHT